MAGLTISGFVPETLSEIKERIKGKLELINPGFDFSPESPDGQLIEIMSFEIWQAWTQLDVVYNSFNPAFATGAALRNIGLITGIPYGTANRSYVTIELQGTEGTVIPANSLVTDDIGNEFYLASAATIPNSAQAICRVPGPVVVTSGTVINIKTPVTGWSGITQNTEGVIGSLAMQDQEYRNLRTATIMRNYTSTTDTMRGRLIELGVGQATVFNNDSNLVVDNVPANTVAVTIGDQGAVSDESVATVIFETNAVGCPTFGTTTVAIKDQQGFYHDINYTKAVAVPVGIVLDVKFPTIDTAGAEESIKDALLGYINSLPAGSDVIWSRLFQYITPFAEAEVIGLTVGKLSGTQGTFNVELTDTEYASITEADITYSATTWQDPASYSLTQMTWQDPDTYVAPDGETSNLEQEVIEVFGTSTFYIYPNTAASYRQITHVDRNGDEVSIGINYSSDLQTVTITTVSPMDGYIIID